METRVYSLVMVGMILQRCVSSVTSGLSSHEGHLRNLVEPCQGNTDASHGEAKDQASFSGCQSDIGLPINFQEESGIVNF